MAPPDVSFAEFNGEWTLEVGPKRPEFGQVEDKIEAVVLGAEMSPDVESVVRIEREITMPNPCVQFKYSLEDMLSPVRRGQREAQGNLSVKPARGRNQTVSQFHIAVGLCSCDPDTGRMASTLNSHNSSVWPITLIKSVHRSDDVRALTGGVN
jgi:hypothetical protein